MGIDEVASAVRKQTLPAAGHKDKAVFLDRDGTITEEGDVIKPEQLRVLPRSAEGIALLNRLGFLAVVVTNQPIIEKGLLTRAESDRLNDLLCQELAKQGAHVDAVYTCPHRYPSDCRCRKPATGMIEEAAVRFGIDLSKSFMIGDSARDVQTGKNAHMRTILVETGAWEHDPSRQFFDASPDFVAEDLLSAARLICEPWRR